jgi:hypothetical protein
MLPYPFPGSLIWSVKVGLASAEIILNELDHVLGRAYFDKLKLNKLQNKAINLIK